MNKTIDMEILKRIRAMLEIYHAKDVQCPGRCEVLDLIAEIDRIFQE
jgi:hypothetical protein